MITRTSGNNRKVLRRKDVELSDMELLCRYTNLKKVPCSISSPLRNDDRNPSFRIWQRGDRIYWKDFGTGEHGTVVDLLALLWNMSYDAAIERLVQDTSTDIPHYSFVRKYKGRVKLGGGGTIHVKIRAWRNHDVEFWKSFGISRSMCEYCDVHPISQMFFEHEGKVSEPVRADKYAYAYFEWKDGVNSMKIYQPYSLRLKWLSSHNSSVWDLWEQSMKWAKEKNNEACIITSSRKDAMCLWQNLMVPAMSLQGEGYIPKPQVMRQVLDTFKKVYLWYDNDYGHEDGSNPGQENAHKLIQAYPELHNIVIPEKYKAKDPSDLYRSWGKETLKMIYDDSKL